MKWRLVDSDMLAPAFSAACDEAILVARNEEKVPNTLHLYRRNAPTISMGHFERVKEVVDLEAASRHGVQIVRRMSGGSAIYTDQGQIIYSLFIDRGSAPGDPVRSFEMVCRGIVLALEGLGLDPEFKPVNDVQIGGKKISGSAQLRRWGVLAQHGSLLVDTDLDIMCEVLKARKRPRGDMTSLREELGYVPDMEVVKTAIVRGFSSAFGVEFERGDLTEEERDLADKLEKEKYSSPEHTYLR